MDAGTWLGLGTLVTAVVGLSRVGWQLHEQRRAMRAEFGNLYIQRFWDIDDDLLFEDKNSQKHRQHRYRYLRLFEDEFDVAKLGFLDRQQWRAWHSVLDAESAVARVRGDLEVCDPEHKDFERLRACIKQRSNGGRHDVSTCDGARIA